MGVCVLKTSECYESEPNELHSESAADETEQDILDGQIATFA